MKKQTIGMGEAMWEGATDRMHHKTLLPRSQAYKTVAIFIFGLFADTVESASVTAGTYRLTMPMHSDPTLRTMLNRVARFV